ncbi:MAG: hypothetical protein J07HQW2_00787 [Haloquadratum walsbyi J07HQW2]|jgi:hypothetical protein|uniref:Uncharacterized protein n=1 Tax=Haloquadratum walsbyi J07HQW2 TaxID=1238425 RepID=U1NCG6_9EURY|nr:MAG: hypothetical protein J07HQW2_00787 [Haloquadratum walsbyi J07HQW2]
MHIGVFVDVRIESEPVVVCARAPSIALAVIDPMATTVQPQQANDVCFDQSTLSFVRDPFHGADNNSVEVTLSEKHIRNNTII